jgi:hypothetical protein
MHHASLVIHLNRVVNAADQLQPRRGREGWPGSAVVGRNPHRVSAGRPSGRARLSTSLRSAVPRLSSPLLPHIQTFSRRRRQRPKPCNYRLRRLISLGRIMHRPSTVLVLRRYLRVGATPTQSAVYATVMLRLAGAQAVESGTAVSGGCALMRRLLARCAPPQNAKRTMPHRNNLAAPVVPMSVIHGGKNPLETRLTAGTGGVGGGSQIASQSHTRK